MEIKKENKVLFVNGVQMYLSKEKPELVVHCFATIPLLDPNGKQTSNSPDIIPQASFVVSGKDVDSFLKAAVDTYAALKAQDQEG